MNIPESGTAPRAPLSPARRRARRVAALRRRIERGGYLVDTDDVAARMLRAARLRAMAS